MYTWVIALLRWHYNCNQKKKNLIKLLNLIKTHQIKIIPTLSDLVVKNFTAHCDVSLL